MPRVNAAHHLKHIFCLFRCRGLANPNVSLVLEYDNGDNTTTSSDKVLVNVSEPMQHDNQTTWSVDVYGEQPGHVTLVLSDVKYAGEEDNSTKYK